MGKLVVNEMMTLDGVAQSPSAPDEDGDRGFALGGWQAPLTDPDGARAMFEQERSMDALLLGRKTYEIFAGYWPTASDEIPFTRLLNGVPKYVAGRTLVDGTVPTALRLIESVTHTGGTLQLTYETAGLPAFGNLAAE